MNKSILTICTFALALATSSCLDSDNTTNSQSFTYSNQECFARVIDSQTGDAIVCTPSYTFVFDIDDSTVSTSITNLQLSSSFSGLNLKLEPLKYALDSKTAFYTATGTNLTPVSGSSVLVDNFSLRAIIGRSYGNVYLVNYTIDSRYSVLTYPRYNIYLGQVTSVDAKEGTSYTTDAASPFPIQVTLDPVNQKATFLVADAKFSASGSVYSFYIKDIPYTYNPAGYDINQDGPFVLYNPSNLEMEDFSVSNLDITGVVSRGALVSFDITIPEVGTYRVSADLQYLSYINS